VEEARWLPLTGTFNGRDLGGLPTVDGRTTAAGRLLRTDTLQELTSDDVQWLKTLGLRTVIDLRTPFEVEREGRGPLEDTDVGYFNFSFVPSEMMSRAGQDRAQQEKKPEVDDSPGSKPEVIVRDRSFEQRVDHYLDYLIKAPDQVAGSLAALAEPGATPAIFHCAAGKDRTGILAALLLSLGGAQPSAIVADFALTNERLPLVAGRLGRLPTYSRGVEKLPYDQLMCQPETMVQFLKALDERWGGARSWGRGAGLDDATLDRLEGLLRTD
jgi:protein-tyrosine phosphatase